MFRRFVSLLLILGSMALIVYANPFDLPETVSPTLILGFMLLAAYCIGFILEQMGLPRITGYIFAGLLLGPYFLKFYSKESVDALGFLNSLALAFIVFFVSGGELKLTNIRNKLKSIPFSGCRSHLSGICRGDLACICHIEFYPIYESTGTRDAIGCLGNFRRYCSGPFAFFYHCHY